jgi:hypothetical protein
MKIDPEIIKTAKNAALPLIIMAAVCVFIYVIWPYTTLGKQVYQDNRNNAINYIKSTGSMTGEGYVKERARLMEKYHISENETQYPDLKHLLK